MLLSFFVCFAAFIPRLHAYSAITTLKRVFSLNSSHSTYSFLNGIRAISLLWIILGHSFIFQLIVSDNVVHILDDLKNSYAMQLLTGAVFGVDTFFFISGFLAVFVFIDTFKDQSRLFHLMKELEIILLYLDVFRIRHLFLYYFHRYCRLIPTLVFVLLISLYLTPWFGQGPIYPSDNGFELVSCRHRWWTTILFLNNIITPEKSCLPVTW